MLVFNEGVPRSGKSYDAVKSHILPALKKGRTVYARLNGLDHDKIAAHLKMDVQTIREKLICVPTGKVVETFQAVRPAANDGESGSDAWSIPAHLQNALFVIDEVHEFYVTGRAPLPEPVEQFFALHGQNGMDGVIMTQAYKRLHAVIRARIERKNQFQKLTAVGFKNRYRVRYFVTIAPDKYERVGGDTFKYDASIFPLYSGYAAGAHNVDVYDGGGKSVWSKLARPLLVAGVALFFAVPVLWKFVHGDVKLVKSPPPAHMATTQAAMPAVVAPDAPAPVKSAMLPTGQHGSFDTKGMPAEVAYVFEMSQQARPRVAAVIEGSRGAVGIIEWREDQSHVLERMTFDELRSMGVAVEVKPYGVKISWEKQVIVATRWPVDMPGTIAADMRSSSSVAASVTPSVSEPSHDAAKAAEKAKWGDRPTNVAYVPPELTTVSALGSDR